MKIFLQFIGICVVVMVIGHLATTGQTALLVGFSVALVIVVAAWALSIRGQNLAWKNRAQRLCTNCLATAQPFQKQNGVLYCPHCQADNPAPLDSPFAREHQARTASHA
jgi:Zn finger protein HypA/HybF involved in hydrogenase expression